jgi:hypothetical protein
MANKSAHTPPQSQLRRLFRSMDFVSRHPALKRETAEARRLAEIYQQLGLAREFLALQCRHRGGWRKLRDGQSACKVCGLIRGVKRTMAVAAARRKENDWPPRVAQLEARVSESPGGDSGE